MGKERSDESADNPPRHGRKKFQFIQRGKAALNAKIKKVLRPRSPTLPPDAPGPEAPGGLPLRGEEAHEALLAGEQYGVVSERIEAHEAPVMLKAINYTAQGYKLVDIINTENLPQWFHEQKNDYQPKEHSESQLVKLTWFGHPGDSPHNIRARKFVVRWASIASPEAQEMAVSKNRPVWRWLYVCAGVHDRVPPDSGLDSVASQATTHQPSNEHSDAGIGSDAASEAIEDDENSEDSDDGTARKRWNKCSSEVRLQVEITADNLAVVKIWQKGEHEDVDQSRLWLLMFSRFLRLQIMDRARRFGARATAIQRDLVGQFLLPSSSGGSVQLPEHRIPTQKQVRVMVSTSKHRTRLARNPFRATWLMVKRNSRDMYYYNPHDFEAPDHKSKFTVAITDNFSLDSTILNTAAPNGTLFMDSTHRLHNENRAATTVLCTANEGKHVMPVGAYLISANIQASTIKDWFVETIRKIEACAQEVAADKSRIHHRDPAATDRLYARCQRIAANGKFDFTNINIDKSRSEYNGILGITNYYIRLCQFHVIFAILRFDFDNGDQGLGFTIPVTMKAQILILFRALQRCRSMEQWEDAKRTFHAGLARSKRVPQPNTKKAKNAGKPVLQVVQEYFDQNWFVEPWIKLFTDIGMPPGQSRDDTWNTNNWAETAFKQFNAVFLDNKHNKRIDQLASIILNHHLPYFCFFPTPDRGPSKAFLQLNHDANKLWETEMVTPSAVPDTFMVRRVEYVLLSRLCRAY
ncbi:hypothetical protein R3P38DRAFT_2544135 [Favolaschia claudopus]|uniref:Transposase n=1 Tax=Favolaschia claudopus TaxID=2862362 RepID=A0AAW0APR8_9AGAR